MRWFTASRLFCVFLLCYCPPNTEGSSCLETLSAFDTCWQALDEPERTLGCGSSCRSLLPSPPDGPRIPCVYDAACAFVEAEPVPGFPPSNRRVNDTSLPRTTPSSSPSSTPSAEPSARPSAAPSADPSSAPTAVPSSTPTAKPSCKDAISQEACTIADYCEEGSCACWVEADAHRTCILDIQSNNEEEYGDFLQQACSVVPAACEKVTIESVSSSTIVSYPWIFIFTTSTAILLVLG